MTKTTEYSQNWKKLKQQLKEQKVETKRPKRKVHDDSQSPCQTRKKSRKMKNDENARSNMAKTDTKTSVIVSSKQHPLKNLGLCDSQRNIKNEIWFETDNAAVRNIVAAETGGITLTKQNISKEGNKLVKSYATDELTKIIGMDCATVGVGEMKESALARVSIVNRHGVCVYDKFVETKEAVTDYRTHVSGIEASDMEKAEKFEKVQQEVADMLLGRILVGHSLYYSLKALFLTHPTKHTKDTARQSLFKSFSSTHRPALRVLCRKFLNVEIQKGRRSTVENAQAAMKLFIMHKRDWGHIRSKKRYKKVLARRKNAGDNA